MKNIYLKRTICTALAGLMIALTSCGNVSEQKESPASTGKNTSSSAGNADPTTTPDDTIAEPDETNMSVKPLSEVSYENSDETPDDSFNAAYRNYSAELFKTT